MNQINVRGQQLVQTQLRKADNKVVEEGQKKIFKNITELINAFQNGEIPISEFKENAEKLRATDFKVTEKISNRGDKRANITFVLNNKKYNLDVPYSRVDDKLFDTNSVNSTEGSDTRDFSDWWLQQKMSHYANLKEKWEDKSQDWSDDKKLRKLRNMRDILNDILCKMSDDEHYDNYKKQYINDYMRWNQEENKIKAKPIELPSNVKKLKKSINNYLDQITGNNAPEDHHATINIATAKQQVDYWKAEVANCDAILNNLYAAKAKLALYDIDDVYNVTQKVLDCIKEYQEIQVENKKSLKRAEHKLLYGDTINLESESFVNQNHSAVK